MKERPSPKYLLFYLSCFFLFWCATSRDSITLDAPLTYGETLVSSGGVFTLGFFISGNSNYQYIGIWYTQITQKTVVWVANRDKPMVDSTGVLSVNTNGSNLQLQATSKVFWSTSSFDMVSPVARLLDTGNFVLMENDTGKIAWQSFDYPTDTVLPGLKCGIVNGQSQYLTSWVSSNDPSSSNYTIKLDPAGFPEYFIWDGSKRVYRTGPWNGRQFSGEPEMESDSTFTFVFVSNPNETYYTFYVNNTSVISRLVLNESQLVRYVSDGTDSWTVYWAIPRDQCDNYAQCGPYGMCSLNSSNVPNCACLTGFKPESEELWQLHDTSAGCIRRVGLNCTGDGFISITDVKLPDTTNAAVDSVVGLEECRKRCLMNCSCTGYSNSDVSNGGSGCMMWVGDLVDIRQFSGSGQTFYYRVAGSEVSDASNTTEEKKKKNVAIIVIPVILGLLVLASIGYLIRRIVKKNPGQTQTSTESTRPLAQEHDQVLDEGSRSQGNLSGLPLYDARIISAATNKFSPSNKLGEGGFGTVFEGLLEGGERIAVKRLAHFSTRGLDEFKNEVLLIAKLQHINLVRLLGYCIEGEEMMLIYEYMENKSLDTFIFDRAKSSQLDWQKRFEIIKGIARGILYLHQDSRLRIVHRDLKASNILLDENMTPKISDFGLARIFDTDEMKSHTKRVVGTYGYMAPEYAMDGIFSIKSDVFSFGVLVLEIISGKKNRRIFDGEHFLNLNYAWKLWKDGKFFELLDPFISENSNHMEEIMRCIQVGLLCVQDRPDDRPHMSEVMLMLNSQDAVFTQPKQPGLFTDKFTSDTESSSRCTVYDTTITIVEPRL